MSKHFLSSWAAVVLVSGGLAGALSPETVSAQSREPTSEEAASGSTLYFPDYVDGGGWSVQLVLLNTDATTAARADVAVYNQNGQTVRSLFSRSSISIPSLGTRVLRSRGTGSVRRGWITVEADTPSVSGLLTYRHNRTGIEVGVKPGELGKRFALFVEKSSDIGTGLAIFKPDDSTGVELRIRDEEGNDPLDGEVARVRNFNQRARTIREWFGDGGVDTGFLSNFRGLLIVRSEDQSRFAPLGLRFGKITGSLSAVPVVRLAAAAAADCPAPNPFGGCGPIDPPPPPAAPTASLSASPTSIERGQSATLTWSSTNATSASITPGIGTVPTSGSRRVSPSRTTTYRITVRSADGQTASDTARVTVTEPPTAAPTVSLSASPSSIERGQSATLRWSSTNAASATISPGIGTVPTSGSRRVSPSRTTTYRITVRNSDGRTASDTARVTVTDPPSSEPEAGAGKMYWTEHEKTGPGYKIRRANLDGSGVEDLITGLRYSLDLALDVAGGKMYWAEIETAGPEDKIRRANLDGSGVEDLITGPHSSSSLALDVAGGKMYLDGGEKIQRANLDGSGVEDLITEVVVLDLALDVAGGKMYWTKFDFLDPDPNKIRQRANLDGSGVEDLITGLRYSRGLALDVAGGKMYWLEQSGERESTGSSIRRANLDGSGVEDLITGSRYSERYTDLALDVAGGKMYLLGFDTNTIRRANLDGSGVEDLITVSRFLSSIALDLGRGSYPTVNLSASPSSIERGQSATLRWSSTNAASATISPGIGTVPTSGSRRVSPTRTTTYRITVRNADGQTASDTARVTVTDPPPDGADDFKKLTGLRVRDDGRIVLRRSGIHLEAGPGRCITISGTLNGQTWRWHRTWWQHNTGSGWREVSGTRKTDRICGYDLSDAPAGRYRLVGDITAAGTRDRYKSENEVTK